MSAGIAQASARRDVTLRSGCPTVRLIAARTGCTLATEGRWRVQGCAGATGAAAIHVVQAAVPLPYPGLANTRTGSGAIS